MTYHHCPPTCSRIVSICFLLSTFVATGYAQSERYELGKRLRRFEQAWQSAEAEFRNASTPAMQSAVQSFFGLQLSTAGRYLDDAYFASTNTSPSTFDRNAIALRVDVQPVLLDANTATARLRMRPFYRLRSATDAERPDPLANARVSVRLLNKQGTNQVSFEHASDEVRDGVELNFEKLPPGDYWLEATVVSDSAVIALPAVQISFVERLSERLAPLARSLDEVSADDTAAAGQWTVRATLRQTVQTLQAMADGRSQETDIPAHRLLELSEELIARPDDASELLRAQAKESVWMVLSNGRLKLPVRVHLPSGEQADGTPAGRPILFAFHGAGGSENMFFETYGAGRLVELASERGWIVVTPRHPLLGMPFTFREMIELLKPFYPIDDKRVFLVGHSMGAGEVVRQVANVAERPQAAVAIGGGGRAGSNESTRSTPWLVAAGELDFGRSGAKALSNRLKDLNASVTYSDYPDVEHMVIVQAALDEVFSFLDQYAKLPD